MGTSEAINISNMTLLQCVNLVTQYEVQDVLTFESYAESKGLTLNQFKLVIQVDQLVRGSKYGCVYVCRSGDRLTAGGDNMK